MMPQSYYITVHKKSRQVNIQQFSFLMYILLCSNFGVSSLWGLFLKEKQNIGVNLRSPVTIITLMPADL